MKSWLFLGLVLLSATLRSQEKKAYPAKRAGDYFPPSGAWERRAPSESGFDTAKLQEAIRFAVQHETHQPRDLALSQSLVFGKEPFNEPIGPLADRGDPTGLIVHKGYIVAEWGEPGRVDMTNSVTKSFLSSVIGLAVDQGRIRNVEDKVADYIPPVEVFQPPEPRNAIIFPFQSPHNRELSWDVMLRQTSDWEGELWGKPDWADRPSSDSSHWKDRKRNAPGTVWKYNDIRVNALALAATCVWREPLPKILRDYIMDPIGASGTWRWYGYRNSWIVLDGLPIQSVSGGGHWGGGMFINAYDMARFGLLTLHRGNWKGRRLISEKWIERSLTPTPAEPTYGYMNFFLNKSKKSIPSAPASAFAHVGNGANLIYVDPENDLVVVVRWIEYENVDELVKKLLESMNLPKRP